MNNTITFKIEAPELASAIAKLADSITANHNTQPQNAPQTAANPTPGPVTAPAPPPVPVTAQTAPLSNPAPQTGAPVSTVPVTGAPTYTLDQISKAGAALVDAGKMEPLLALLTKYGVQAITQLQPAQYGVFAMELRALGAQI